MATAKTAGLRALAQRMHADENGAAATPAPAVVKVDEAKPGSRGCGCAPTGRHRKACRLAKAGTPPQEARKTRQDGRQATRPRATGQAGPAPAGPPGGPA